jgi:hypothetical protein
MSHKSFHHEALEAHEALWGQALPKRPFVAFEIFVVKAL